MKNLSLYDNNLSVPRKQDVDDKQDQIKVKGLLEGDGTGGINAAETENAELVELTKALVGLGNVDNTSDTDKPISTATQAALDLKQPAITVGAAGDILKVKSHSDAADEFEPATPNEDYMTPSMGVTGSSEGYVLRVKTIDADGNPTAWETVSDPPVSMRVYNNYIQYSNDDGATWNNVVAMSALKGDAGYSPTITTQSMTGGVYISIKNQSTQYGAFIKNGTNGTNGITFTPSVSEDGVISWSNDGTLENPSSVNIKGPAGADGYTPTVSVTPTSTGATITVRDQKSVQTTQIKNGADGKTPEKGTDYFTAEDKAELVSDVLAQLPAAHQIGDTLTTVRTDLGDKWLLCNGAAVDRQSYPALNNLLTVVPTSADAYRDITKTAQTTAGNRAKKLNGKYFITGTPLQYADDYAGTWTSTSVNATDICFFDGKYVVADGTTTLSYSTDLNNWSTVTLTNSCSYLASTEGLIAASDMRRKVNWSSSGTVRDGAFLSYVATSIEALASAAVISNVGAVQECNGDLFGFYYDDSPYENSNYHYITTTGYIYKYNVEANSFSAINSGITLDPLTPRQYIGTSASYHYVLGYPYVTMVADTYVFFLVGVGRTSAFSTTDLTNFTAYESIGTTGDSAGSYVTIAPYVFAYTTKSAQSSYKLLWYIPAGGILTNGGSSSTNTIGLSGVGYGESAFAMFVKDASTIRVMDVKKLPTISQNGVYTYIKALD